MALYIADLALHVNTVNKPVCCQAVNFGTFKGINSLVLKTQLENNDLDYPVPDRVTTQYKISSFI